MTPSDDDEGGQRVAEERQAAELAALRPAAPSAGLRSRIATELSRSRPASFRGTWPGLVERLAWAAAGAVAASLVLVLTRAVPEPAVASVALPPETASEPDGVPTSIEESIVWSDEGVRFLDHVTPARILRRRVVERHPAGDGRAEVRLPREDLILLPVAIR